MPPVGVDDLGALVQVGAARLDREVCRYARHERQRERWPVDRYRRHIQVLYDLAFGVVDDCACRQVHFETGDLGIRERRFVPQWRGDGLVARRVERCHPDRVAERVGRFLEEVYPNAELAITVTVTAGCFSVDGK